MMFVSVGSAFSREAKGMRTPPFPALASGDGLQSEMRLAGARSISNKPSPVASVDGLREAGARSKSFVGRSAGTFDAPEPTRSAHIPVLLFLLHDSRAQR